MIVRVVLAVVVSVGLAVLMAWGWNVSDAPPTPEVDGVNTDDSSPVRPVTLVGSANRA